MKKRGWIHFRWLELSNMYKQSQTIMKYVTGTFIRSADFRRYFCWSVFKIPMEAHRRLNDSGNFNYNETLNFLNIYKKRHYARYNWIDLIHKSHNAIVSYPRMQHFVTEICTCVHISVTKWCILEYYSDALWDWWNRYIPYSPCCIWSCP